MAMQFFKFYGLVFREAFRHSLDIAQAVIFVLLAFSGFIAARNPTLKPMIDGLDLGGWQIAAIVFGSIVAIRLILAPYWLWRSANARIANAPANTIDYQLRVVSFGNRNNKPKRLIQVVFNLRNSLGIPLVYEVEDIDVTINGLGNDNPTFQNMGGVVPAFSINTFDYAPIQLEKWIKRGTEGAAGITYKYGIAGSPFSRRARFVAKLIIEKNNIRHLTIEDTETAI